MQWAIFGSLSLAVVAVIAAATALFLLARLSATVVSLSGALSTLEKTERLTPSRLAELAEYRESLARAEQLLEKVNRRAIANAKPRSEDGTFAPGGDVANLKDALRRKAGLKAGEPARHA